MHSTLVKTIFGRARGPSKDYDRVPQLTHSNFDLLQSPQTVLFDLRPAIAFAAAFIPGSINLPEFQSPELVSIEGLNRRRSVYLLAERCELVEQAAKFFDRFEEMAVLGWFSPLVIDEWRRTKGPVPSIEYISPETLAVRVAAWKTTVADLRSEKAFRHSHIPDAIRVPIGSLVAALIGLPVATSLSLICESGKICSIAASLLWNAGYRNLAIVAGGFEAYLHHKLPLVRA